MQRIVPVHKTWEGEEYTFVEGYHSQGGADGMKDHLQRQGYACRVLKKVVTLGGAVTKQAPFYFVYARKPGVASQSKVHSSRVAPSNSSMITGAQQRKSGKTGRSAKPRLTR